MCAYTASTAPVRWSCIQWGTRSCSHVGHVVESQSHGSYLVVEGLKYSLAASEDTDRAPEGFGVSRGSTGAAVQTDRTRRLGRGRLGVAVEVRVQPVQRTGDMALEPRPSASAHPLTSSSVVPVSIRQRMSDRGLRNRRPVRRRTSPARPGALEGAQAARSCLWWMRCTDAGSSTDGSSTAGSCGASARVAWSSRWAYMRSRGSLMCFWSQRAMGVATSVTSGGGGNPSCPPNGGQHPRLRGT